MAGEYTVDPFLEGMGQIQPAATRMPINAPLTPEEELAFLEAMAQQPEPEPELEPESDMVFAEGMEIDPRSEMPLTEGEGMHIPMFTDAEGMQVGTPEDPYPGEDEALAAEYAELDAEEAARARMTVAEKRREAGLGPSFEELLAAGDVEGAMNASRTHEDLDRVIALQEEQMGISKPLSFEDYLAIGDVENAMNTARTQEDLDRVLALQDQQLGPELDPIMPREYMTAEERYAERQAMTPEERMMADAEDAQRRTQHMANLREQKLQADADQQSRNLLNLQQSNKVARQRTEDLMRRTQELAEQEVDPNRWYNSRDTAQIIAAGIASAISGVLDPKGQNDTIRLINQQVDRDINMQVADLQRKRGLLSDESGLVAKLYNMGMSEYEAAEGARMATFARMEQELAVEAAKYDPAGQTARRLEQQMAAYNAAKQEAARKLEAHNLDVTLKLNEQHRKNVETQAKAAEAAMRTRKLGEETRLLERKGRGGRGRPKALSVEQQRKLIDAGYLPYVDPRTGLIMRDPDWDPSKAPETKEALEIKKIKGDIAGQDIRSTGLEFQHELREESVKVPVLKNADGSTYTARTPEQADEIATKKTALDKSVDVLDKILAVRHEKGVELFASQDAKLMDAMMSDLMLFKREAAKTGALDEGSVKVIMESLTGGSKRPSKTLRDFDKAMKSARKIMVDGYNSDARTFSKDPDKYKEYQPPRMEVVEAHERSKSELMSAASAPMIEGESREEAIADAQTNINVFLKREDVGKEDITEMARALNKAEHLTREDRISMVNSMAQKYLKKERERDPSERVRGAIFTEGVGLEDPADVYLRILEGTE